MNCVICQKPTRYTVSLAEGPTPLCIEHGLLWLRHVKTAQSAEVVQP